MTLAKDISKELDKAITSASGEVAIIKQFIDNLNGLKTPRGVDIKTGFCHQKPYAHFVSPSHYVNRKKCELGDILWIYKTVSQGIVTDHRATFSQAKHSRIPTFRIEEHQYQFLVNIDSNSFEFGKAIYRNAGYQPIVFKAITQPRDFSNYLCLRPSWTPKCECTSDLKLLTPTSINTVGMQTFELYIDKFFNGSFSMDVQHNTNGRKLVDIVCKRLNLALDVAA